MVSREHRAPLVAFLLVLGVAGVVLMNGVRTEVVRGLLDTPGRVQAIKALIAPDMVLAQTLEGRTRPPAPARTSSTTDTGSRSGSTPGSTSGTTSSQAGSTTGSETGSETGGETGGETGSSGANDVVTRSLGVVNGSRVPATTARFVPRRHTRPLAAGAGRNAQSAARPAATTTGTPLRLTDPAATAVLRSAAPTGTRPDAKEVAKAAKASAKVARAAVKEVAKEAKESRHAGTPSVVSTHHSDTRGRHSLTVKHYRAPKPPKATKATKVRVAVVHAASPEPAKAHHDRNVHASRPQVSHASRPQDAHASRPQDSHARPGKSQTHGSKRSSGHAKPAQVKTRSADGSSHGSHGHGHSKKH